MNRHLKFYFSVFAIILFYNINAQKLSVEKIMQDPKWMGTFPSDVHWDINSEHVFFDYNPEKNPSDSVYVVNIKKPNLIQKANKKLLLKSERNFISKHDKSSQYLSLDNGNLMIYEPKFDKPKLLLDLDRNIRDAEFLNENKIGLVIGNNAFIFDIENVKLRQVTQIEKGKKPEEQSNEESWIEKENTSLIKYIAKKKEQDSLQKAYYDAQNKDTYTFYTDKKYAYGFQISASLNAVAFNLSQSHPTTTTKAADYVDDSGYTTMVDARPKVGKESRQSSLVIYNLKNDTAYVVEATDLPGIKNQPKYLEEYGEINEDEPRPVDFSRLVFSPNGNLAVVEVRSQDNKDRWICQVDLNTGKLTSLDHQNDEAWIGGPGIGNYGPSGVLGWLPDNKHIYFQSEETGFSHLYTLNIDSKTKTALTSGNYEVFNPEISKDEKHWYFTASKGDLGQRHFFKMPLQGGQMTRLTKGIGRHQVTLSPDEKYMADVFSKANQPQELFIKKTKVKAEPEQITDGQSEAFKSYAWQEPEFIEFKAEDGTMVPARLYQPDNANRNNAAVIFVHGAGYLQNAHKWWSSYFREYMFHNLLTDLGYTVLDIDYRGSAGYGRDWRTAIYRHMGGKDLSDQVDGADYLKEQHGTHPDKIGIYGGSYGGFITLMALFNEADTFKTGAALRSVTDWAHYNHDYTSNILNTPEQDPKAYRRSSPIYFAEGLKGHLLMAHGVMDTNVQFQDIVRLSQRLIELGKDNWELAIYPVEGHGFTEPESWTDEYKRILKLFEETLKD
ncbi:S9 family peptidase [Flavobacteriaceae bacterium 14752]|nr:S9 family peptidase [Flavobacteriaceae bacterium 14752]